MTPVWCTLCLLAATPGSSLATATDHHRDNIMLTLAFLRDPAALKLISQYESRLARDFARTLTQLRQSQGSKRTGPRVDASQRRTSLSAMEENPPEQNHLPHHSTCVYRLRFQLGHHRPDNLTTAIPIHSTYQSEGKTCAQNPFRNGLFHWKQPNRLAPLYSTE